MMQGLERVSSLLRLYKIREGLYIDKSNPDLVDRHLDFESAVIELYFHILKFQARLISHLSKFNVACGSEHGESGRLERLAR